MTSAFHINTKLAAATFACGSVGATRMGANALTADDASLAERCVR
jgi:hypothetical protein